MRQPRIYNPEERKYLEEGVYCSYCGNSSAFQIELKLKHLIKSRAGSLSLELLKSYTDKVMNIVSRNVEKLLEKGWEGKPRFCCANCHEDSALDTMGRSYDYCYYNGCPGCFTCGEWISLDDLKSICSECIKECEGSLNEDDCMYNCPNYDRGLLEVMDHHGITLGDLKEELGY